MRVSDTVSTATLSGLSSRASRHGGEVRCDVGHCEIVHHPQSIFAPAVVRGLAADLAITEPLVEAARGVVGGTQLELHGERARDARGRLEPLDELTADTEPLIARLDGEQAQVGVLVVVLHDRESREPAPVARREHDAVAVLACSTRRAARSTTTASRSR